MMKSQFTLIIVFIICFFSSCKQVTEPKEYSLPNIQHPNLTGSSVHYSDEPMTIVYCLSEGSRVNLWVEKSYGLNEKRTNNATCANGKYYSPSNDVVAIIVESFQRPGNYIYKWDFHISDDQILQPGFYRIYLATEYDINSMDLLLLNR
ncbi:MAG: hypothetical protein JXR46_16315 [Calditrichaceae bacterium]|nr:hypothetical protein [Calditrichaceae bacterium]MBN2710610.1 hypothetical protein [Calditrichaceae bacterium]RQV96790.1 MAG: hypothetical protein EH224_03440 [Calditrichota bacterium]